MFSNTQEASKGASTGFYHRAKRQLRSLSRRVVRHSGSNKELTNLAVDQSERPWPGLAEWLRVAHSLLDDKTAKLNSNPER